MVDDFCDKQKVGINALKESVIGEWIPTLSNIYKTQISELNRSQTKSITFFNSTATQLHLQMRGLVERGLNEYHQFIKRFDQSEVNPPDTVVFLERTKNYYEDCFLSVRLSHRREGIYFMDSLDGIEQKLLEVVDHIRLLPKDTPRP